MLFPVFRFRFYWIHYSPLFLVYYIFPYLYILVQFRLAGLLPLVMVLEME